MVLIFGECHQNSRNAAALYAERYPERYHPPHNYFLRIVINLRENGELPAIVNHRRNRRPRVHEPNENEELQVLAYIQINPHSSVRNLAREVGVSVGKAHSILKKHKFHAYRPNIIQHLIPDDSGRRLTFIAWLMVKIQEEPLFLNYVCWTDESKFTNNGVINKQNNRYWSDTNPHWTNDSNFQHVWGTNVWCGLLCGRLLGPYFYNGTLTGRRYLDFLSNTLPTFLDEFNLDTRMNLFFQQDGAPAHNAIIVREYLNQTFGHKWMGTYGPVQWPPRSPDITPLDYFLWGHLKTVVYANPPINIEDLKNKIIIACSELTQDQIITATQRELLRRMEACVENNCNNFEQFIE